MIIRFLVPASVVESVYTMNQVTTNKHTLQEQKPPPPHAHGVDLERSHSEHLCGLKIQPRRWDRNAGEMIESAQESGFQASWWRRDIAPVTGHPWTQGNSPL